MCSFTEWSGWGRCSKTCGGGKQARVRRPIRPTDAALSIYCEGGLTEIQDCSRYLCPGSYTIVLIHLTLFLKTLWHMYSNALNTSSQA